MEISALGVLICKRARQLYRLDLPSSRAIQMTAAGMDEGQTTELHQDRQ